MLDIPIPRTASEYRYDLLLALTLGAREARFTSAPVSAVEHAGDTYRRDTDEQVFEVSLPRLDATLERSECAVRIASESGYIDTWELAGELMSQSGGILATRLRLFLRFPDLQPPRVLSLFSGRLATMEMDDNARLALMFYGGYGQLDSQRSVFLTSADQRAYSPGDDSLDQIGSTQGVVWGRSD